MLLLISVLALGAVASGAPSLDEPLYNGFNYHEVVGIDTAARIKASEEAVDFDGSRIMGGAAARLGQFPFQAGAIILLANGGQSFCGASLISNTRLTTAAHCWTDGRVHARQLTIVLASTTLFSGGTRIVTNRVHSHPHYNPSNLNNDIAVVVINRVAYTQHINNINLPSGNNQYVGVRAIAAGYGRHDNAPVNYGLRYVHLPVISNAECLRTYSAPWVPASALCVSTVGGRSVCSGDSGGPLQNPAGNLLIGVTSFVHRTGCLGGRPAGFARVTSFVPWIRNHM